MGRAVLLTGKPGSGKTTLIRRVLAAYTGPAGGFYTQEIRLSGVRQGFEIITLDGQRGILAHVNIHTSRKIGKYGVNLDALEQIGVPVIIKAVQSGWLVVIDEIGPMEILSPQFRQAVLMALDIGATLLGTIVQRPNSFADQVKRRPEVILIEVWPDNRDGLLMQVLNLLENKR